MLRKLIRRGLKIGSTVVGSILGLGVVAYYFAPVPTSPPLRDSQGIVLDPETQAKLIEIVFDSARHDDVTTVDAYLEEGFSPNVRSPRGDTLLTVAAYHDSVEVVTRLLKHPQIDIEARNRMGLTAVAAAAFKGFDRPLRLLIDHGANVNASNGVNQTAIMFASLSGKTKTVEMLLAAGADSGRVDDLGNTALSVAQTQGATQVLPLLDNAPDDARR